MRCGTVAKEVSVRAVRWCVDYYWPPKIPTLGLLVHLAETKQASSQRAVHWHKIPVNIPRSTGVFVDSVGNYMAGYGSTYRTQYFLDDVFLATDNLKSVIPEPQAQSSNPGPRSQYECTAVLHLLDRAAERKDHTQMNPEADLSPACHLQVVGPPQTSPQADHVRRSVPGEQYPDSTAIVLFPKGLGVRIVASRVQYLGNTCSIVKVGLSLGIC